MTVLVTGADGFIGHHLLARLRHGAQPLAARALVRRAAARPDEIRGDLLDADSLRAACQGVDCVYHCAGFAHAFSATDADQHWRINFEGTRNLLQVAADCGVPRFVFLSSVKAMAEPGSACADEDWPGEPQTPYGQAKRAAEQQVLETAAHGGGHGVNLRLAMVYGRGGRGNLERMARGIRAGWFPPLPETGNRRSLVHVSDVVDAMLRVAETPAAAGRTYIVANAGVCSGAMLYDTIRAILNRPPARLRVPAALLQLGARAGDGLGALLGRPLPLNTEVVERLLGSACYSPARIAKELGWQARTSLADGLREMLAGGGAER